MFIRYTENQCCWGSGKSKNITTSDFIRSNSYVIKLETYTESRTVTTRTKVLNDYNVLNYNYYIIRLMMNQEVLQ